MCISLSDFVFDNDDKRNRVRLEENRSYNGDGRIEGRGANKDYPPHYVLGQ